MLLPDNQSTRKTNDQLQRLDQTFIFLLTSQLVIGITAYFISSNRLITTVAIEKSTAQIMILLVNTITVFLVVLIYKLRANKKSRLLNQSRKFEKYKNTLKIVYAQFIIGNLVNLFLYIFTNESLFIFIFLLMTALFYTYRPSMARFNKDFSN